MGEGVEAALALAKRKGIRIDVQIAEPVGKWEGRKDMLMTPDDSAYIKSLQNTCGRISTGQNMVNRDIYCGEHDHCPAGVEFMGLTADGCLLPCNFLQFSLGNIRDKSIREMRNALLTSPWFQGRIRNCLCGENHEFIERFIAPRDGEPKPLDAGEIFDLRSNETADASRVDGETS